MTLQGPAEVTSKREPTFAGTVKEGGASYMQLAPVSVEIFKAPEGAPFPSPEGSPFMTLESVPSGVEANPSGGVYSVQVASALPDGSYTAVSIEPSALGNTQGSSQDVHFEIDTHAPSVELTQPRSPSNATEPTFSGTVSAPNSETKPVYVYVHEGSEDSGAIVRKVKAEVKSGVWTSSKVTPPLPEGTYTAVATTESTIGNESGWSSPRTFEVETKAPTVTLNEPARTRDTTPTFAGTASENGTEVVVHILEGTKEVAKGKATVGADTWSAAPESALPTGEHSYKVYATEVSGLGNAEGKSAEVSFELDTEPPHVTLDALPTPSSNREPAFSGTASEDSEVTVDIHEGANAGGAIVASTTATVEDGEWFAGKGKHAGKVEQLPGHTGGGDAAECGWKRSRQAIAHFEVAEIPPSRSRKRPRRSPTTRGTARLRQSAGRADHRMRVRIGTNPTPPYGRSVGCGFVSGALEFPPQAPGRSRFRARLWAAPEHRVSRAHSRDRRRGGWRGGGQDLHDTPQEGGPAAQPVVAKKAAQGVKAFTAAQILPSGKGARIGAICRMGAYDAVLQEPRRRPWS